MSLQVEKLEKNMAKLTVEVPAEQFEKAIKKAFNKNKNRFNIPGFRKGKAPQAMIEKMYGVGVFYEDAADEAINETYADAMKESELDIVSRPAISIEQIEKGMKLFLSTPSGMPVPAVVIDVTPEAVTLDANHELAGKDLNFDIELVEVEG